MPLSPLQSGFRKIAIAVDLSDESAHAVKWAVANYLRPGDQVTILHVRPTSVLYGADWGASEQILEVDKEAKQKMEDDFDAFTELKSTDLARPLLEAHVPHKIHIVKDHDLKERICLEIERLGVNAVIMGSRGFGATRRSRKARLGSVSDYCVHHCDCPVVVVRYPEDKDAVEGVASPGGGDSDHLHASPQKDLPKVQLKSNSGKILSGNLEQLNSEAPAVEFTSVAPEDHHHPPPQDLPKVQLNSNSGRILSGDLQLNPDSPAVEFTSLTQAEFTKTQAE